jgi:predicted DNA-binding transcriptional regulator YafY
VVDLAAIRAAIRREQKLVLTYRDLGDRVTTRTVWPVALVYFDRVQVLVAWCELRTGYRHFRPDRIGALAPTAARYPRPRHVLLAEWRSAEGIDVAAGDPLQRRPR